MGKQVAAQETLSKCQVRALSKTQATYGLESALARKDLVSSPCYL